MENNNEEVETKVEDAVETESEVESEVEPMGKPKEEIEEEVKAEETKESTEKETPETKVEEEPEKVETQSASEEKIGGIPAGETPKEWALRKEVETLRGKLRKERTDELFVPSEVSKIKTISPEKQKLLEKYDKTQLDELGEIIKAQAEELGFVKKDELRAETYKETADNLLNTFLEELPEYLPENDKDNTYWNRCKEEFGLYKQPQNPKDFKKIYNRVHESIFGIKTGNLNKINAQQEKLKVASHTGKTIGGVAKQTKSTPEGLRLDMLKGFEKEEIDELTS
jgi:hypothetical protein